MRHRSPVRPRVAYIVTCEHGGNDIPATYTPLFRGRERLLATHRGYDPGALQTARDLAHALHATLVVSTVSRLLVELNRSPGRQFRFSPIMRNAPHGVQDEVCRRHYRPYRDKVEAFVARATAAGARVVHLSSHSFTPLLDGIVRHGDVGLLYDPARMRERELCVRWQRALGALRPDWIVRRNYPYLGRSDGFTSYLRRRYGEASYVGVELEVNQKHVRAGNVPAGERASIVAALCDALGNDVSRVSGARRRTRASATTRASPPARHSAASYRCESRD
ncbi:MAG TPA: N-formylglutamate amidohydrolase [Casimicrobiaceae bacterium]|nr:N-formylglutamate amidohydrolase [Casimicrobiaceae bacterium]